MLRTDETCGACKFWMTDVEGKKICSCENAEEWLEDVTWDHSCQCYELEANYD